MKTTLVSAAELADHLDDANWVVLDCRHDLLDHSVGLRGYEQGHIPGAQRVDVEADLSDKSRGPNGEFRGRHPLPSKAAFVATLRRWGVNPSSQVVVYDAQGGMYAARVWWMLRWVGHAAVAVLDGGLPAWTALNLPLSTEVPTRLPGSISEQPSLVSTVAAHELLESGLTIVDARSPDRFRGENETMDPVGGHIPGAKNRFFKDNLDASGRFKPAEQLRADFSALVSDPSKAAMQCGSGVTACHNLLALEIAGLSGARLYPGSWSEWCSDPSRPVATGAA